jgi:N-acetylmuramic acid 6-phosphate etherase
MAPADLERLVTESGSDPHADYDSRPTAELVGLMNARDAEAASAVAAASASITRAIDSFAERLRRGGRLVYVGAGSSGLLAAVDAAECQSTFATPPGQVLALVAGGVTATPHEQAAAEDDRDAGAREALALELGPDDCVVGVSASGRTPYVLGALEAAAGAGALTACVVCVDGSQLGRVVEHEIAVVVGPEFLAGSTRLAAGTAQKLVLNAISTISMIRLGKTYGNLMVDVVATNDKLQARVRRIVREATDAPSDAVDDALTAADGSAKVAIVSILAGIDASAARTALESAGGSVREALGDAP